MDSVSLRSRGGGRGAGDPPLPLPNVRRQARNLEEEKDRWNTVFSIKAPIPKLPGTSQTAGCASCPSGVHPLSCPCNLVNTFQMSLMEIMCGFGPQRLQTATTRLSQRALAANAAVATVTRATLHLQAAPRIITSYSNLYW